MSLRRLLIASLLYHARAHAAVALCVATGSAVLTGALLVGDSMRGSLRELVLERLGRIDHALVAPGLFRRALADDVRTELARAGHGGAVRVEPAMLLHGSIARIDANGREGTRVGKVDILGVTPGFWALGPSGASPDVAAVWHGDGGSEAVSLNEKLANDLGVRAGDTVLVRTEKPSAIPREAVLGRKDDAVLTRRLTVGSIVPAGALGNFALEPNQHAPRNAYVTLDALAVAVGAPGRANAIFIAGGADRPGASAAGTAPDPAAHAASPQAALARAIRLDDLGLRLRIDPARGTMSLESSRMVLVPAAGSAALEAASDLDLGVAPTLTYLANAIERLAPDGDRLGKSIPYSTVAALPVDAEPPLGPLALESGAPVFVLADDEILLNRWAADDLDAHAGDRIELSYFAAESSVPFATEQAVFRLRGVVAMQGVADDPGLVPDYPGITNAKHYADWDPPFPMDLRRVRPKDETYWDEHRGTPKAFVSLAAGERIWGSRFGRWTSVRVALPASESPVSGPGTALGSARGHAEQRGGDDPADALKDRFEHALLGHLAPEQMGLVFQPVKAQGLAASQGATDFAELFLAFSFFLIAAAVILIALVFRLAVERRAKEPGLLLAVGFDRAQVRNLLLAEGLVTATLGSLIGSAVGVLYTAAMLRGLGTWWLPAVGTSRLTLHVAPLSLAIGFFSGLMLALLAIAGTVRRLSRTTPRALLAGSVSDAAGWVPARAAWSRRIGWACLAVAAGGSAVATLGRLHPATFFLVGSCLLVGALFLLYAGMAGVAGGMVRGHGVAATLRLGVRNGGRHRGRSALTAGLVAFATFVIVAVAANRREALQDAADKRSGSGGFALVAECDPPLLHDLNARAGRRELGFPASADAAFEGVAIFPVRLRPGEDASCLNLYKPTRPRLLGVTPALIDRGGFRFAESLAASPEERANPWRLLDRTMPEGVLAALGDANTVQWILHLGLGKSLPITAEDGRTVQLEIIGLLDQSLFQSELVVSEASFLKLFPAQGGYSYFLIDTSGANSGPGSGSDARLATLLEAQLNDYGFDAAATAQRLAEYHAVENTYLSTFQTLGALGLLLGTVGLGAVLLRSVLERRGELALLRAVGFPRTTLVALVLAEHGFLLVAGLAIGAVSALLAVAPRLWNEASGVGWLSLALTLGAVLLVGLVSGLLSVLAALRVPLIPALRAE